MQVKKSSGEFQIFSQRKIYKSIREAGGSKSLANGAIKKIKSIYHKDISTKEILETLLKFLKKEPGVSERYDLKRAIMSLGPTGFPFEKYFANLLEHYGYETKVGVKLKGKKIIQEVDIVAKKKKKLLIEAKYHNQTGTITRLHPAMYTYARFLDLQKHKFDEPWLVTNTKCSKDAVKYAEGVNLKIISWNYPKKGSLREMIQTKNLFPITILKEITDKTKNKLFENNIVLLKDFEKHSKINLQEKLELKEKEIDILLKEVNDIID